MAKDPHVQMTPRYRETGKVNGVETMNTPGDLTMFVTKVRDGNGKVIDTVTYKRRTGYGRDAERGDTYVREAGIINQFRFRKPRLVQQSTGYRG